MAKKVLLFNYFLQKVAETEQRLWQTDEKAALLAVILSKANVFRRSASGGTSETIWSCQTRYAEDLFWIVCLDAKAHGDDLLKYYQPRASFLFGGEKQWGAPILEETDIEKQCSQIYPKAAPEKELYAQFIKEETMPAIMYATTVAPSKLELPAPDEDTAAIDRAYQRLSDDKEFLKLLNIYSKYEFYGRSLAHKYYATHYASVIPRV